jgi:N-acetylmuramoyl-L-alanine amidase-like protein
VARRVITTQEWGAAPPRGTFAPRGRLRELIVHHTAFATSGIGGTSFEAEARHMRAIQRWHFDRAFITIGYHFVISPSGRVFAGRPVNTLGAHTKGFNTGTVGICLMGNFELEQPAPAALAALHDVRTELVPGGATVPLRGHREHPGHASTACPGRHLLPHVHDEGRLPAAPVDRLDQLG